jgi:2-polyprenyl-3-methyl-5-hydroxy-6-metoxy-1,4-benzoquinol methylase
MNQREQTKRPHWDNSTDPRFYDYYAAASQTTETLRRFRSIRDCILRIVDQAGPLDVADIGCGAGTQSILWAELGHRVYGLDVSEPLLKLARERALRSGLPIQFQLASASELPWPPQSMDVCLVVELLEHVAEWEICLNEFTRVLRPEGVLLLTTSNKLCPIQQEFNLPLYSWYPGSLKRHFERLAVTTHPQLANYARYPAVNWFSFYSLRNVLSRNGFRCLDQFDTMDLPNKSEIKQFAVRCIRGVPLLRWLAHVATPSTVVIGIKKEEPHVVRT